MSLITQLNDVMARRGYTQTHVARAIGRSSAVINQYLQGKYQGDMADIEERISAFVTREREKENSRRIKAKFVATGMAAKGLEVLAYAHLECEICVLYGAAGLGKTMILREYAARNRDAVLIEADPGYTARTLLEELCRQLGVKVRGNIHELIDACVRELRDSGRLLMVDEAELLPYRALEVLRRLHDKAGICASMASAKTTLNCSTFRKLPARVRRVMPVHRRVICTSCVTWSVKPSVSSVTYPANTGLLVHSNVTCVFMALTAARKSRLTRLMCFPVR